MMTNICFQCKHFKSTMINSLGTIVHKCKKYNEYIDPELFWEYPECEGYKKNEVILDDEKV